MSVGEKIMSLRKQRNISQYKLAKLVKVFNQSQISKIEKGFRKISVTDLELFAKALDVKPEDLLKNGTEN